VIEHINESIRENKLKKIFNIGKHTIDFFPNIIKELEERITNFKKYYIEDEDLNEYINGKGTKEKKLLKNK